MFIAIVYISCATIAKSSQIFTDGAIRLEPEAIARIAHSQGMMLAVAGIILYLAYDLILKSKLEPAISNITAGINLFEKQEEARPGEIYHPSVKLCTDTANNRIVELKGKDRYLHTLVVGSTGTGKTTTVLAPMIWQDLQNMLKGHRLGITVVAPDGEFCYQVEDWCKRLGVPYHFIDLDNPNSDKFNPLAEGDPNVVSEIMRTVLRATFGEQEAFFAQAQELHAKNTMLLLKKLMGNKLTMLDVYESLMDLDKVKEQVEGYKSIYGEDILTTYFEKEAFGRNKEKLHQFAMGLRLQISDLLTNDAIRQVLVAESDVNLDFHMENGGVLLVNTALGSMGHMSRVFGQFIIMHIQSAVFRRKGTEFTRMPHYLYIDELPVYFNPELDRLLNIGRKYRCACTFTIQGVSQLAKGKSGASIREIIINGCRNKIVVGVESAEDAKIIAEFLGEEEQEEVRVTRERWSLFPKSYNEGEKYKKRYNYTEILELPAWHGVLKIVRDGRNLPPIMGKFKEPWLFLEEVEKEMRKIPKHQIIIP